jgi:exonuclease III
VRCGTYNAQQGIGDHDASKAMMGKLDHVVALFANEELDVLMIQEFDHRGKGAPLVRNRFKPTAVVHSTAWEPTDPAQLTDPTPTGFSTAGVALIIGLPWAVEPGSIRRHASGRAISAVITRERVTAVVVSVHMPSGLDSKSPKHEAHALAAELYQFIRDATADHELFFVGGDLNETRAAQDRQIGARTTQKQHKRATQKRHKPRSTCLVEQFVSSPGSRFSDLYRSLFPGPNFTRYGKSDESAARLDYFLIPRSSQDIPGTSWKCWVMERTVYSDHCAVIMELTSTTFAGLSPGPPPAPWRPSFPQVRGLPVAVTRKVHRMCNLRAQALLDRWQANGDRPPDRESLATDLAAFVKMLVTTTTDAIPPRRPRVRRIISRQIAAARAKVEAVFAVRVSINSIKAANEGPAARRVAARKPSHRLVVGQLYQALGRVHIPFDDIDGLSIFVDSQEPLLWARLHAIYRGNEYTHDQHRHMAKLFKRDPAGFLDHYVKDGTPSGGARSPDIATDPTTGIRESAPAKVKRIVRSLVKKPMSVAVNLQPTTTPDTSPPRVAGTGPFASLDARATGQRAHWYDHAYEFGSKLKSLAGVTMDVWQAILDPVGIPELLDTLSGTKGGTSPGPDGVTIDLLKLVCRPLDAHACEPPSGPPTPCALALLILTNHSFRLSYVPPALKEGWITLVPKPEADGSSSTEADKMRPITLLSEVGKFGSRIIAKRICRVLAAVPGLLSLHQRAFHMDGAVDQCTNVLVDVIEDWHHKSASLGKRDRRLYVVSYDQAKAYDKVQQFTVRDSMRRFGMPAPLIDYVISAMSDATSRVRTTHGLTTRFKIKSGVRQGDPLAPILYALITDALHEGLRDNPLFPNSAHSGGYTFQHAGRDGEPVRICSAGYADDTVIMAEDPARLAEMHAWVRAFFGAHSFELNTKKTKYLCSHPHKAPTLASVDGTSIIQPLGRDATFRYLGLRLNLKLDWKVERARMRGKVFRLCIKIQSLNFTLPMTVFAIQQLLLPSLRLGLLTAKVTDGELSEWNSLIRRAAMRGASMHAASRLQRHAFLLGSGIPDLRQHMWTLRTEELMVTLNADYPSSLTAWARLNSVGGLGVPSARSATYGRAASDSRLASYIQALAAKDISFKTTPGLLRNPSAPSLRRALDISSPLDPAEALAASTAWRPSVLPALFKGRNPYDATRSYTSYTDGSTGRDRSKMSGSAVVPLEPDGSPGRAHHFPVRPSGSNYMSEMVAILAALLMAAASAPAEIYSDCRSAIQAINHNRDRWWQQPGAPFANTFHIPQRRRILNACQPILNLIRSTIEARGGAVTLHWIRAHTGVDDVHSRMNDAADRAANFARMQATQTWHPLAGWERVYMQLGKIETTGNFRKQTQAFFQRRATAALARDHVHQGRLADLHSERLVEYTEAVRRTRDPALIRFSTELIAEWLPSATVLASQERDDGRGTSCRLCGASEATVVHDICHCLSERSVRARNTSCNAALATLVSPVEASDPLRDGEHAWCRDPGIWITAWFDPSRTLQVEIFPRATAADVADLERFDPLSGFMGIHPPSLDALLCWGKSATGSWTKLSLRQTHERMARLRSALLPGGLHVWEARCRATDIWWTSHASAELVHRAALSAYARAAKRAVVAAARTAKAKVAEAKAKAKKAKATAKDKAKKAKAAAKEAKKAKATTYKAKATKVKPPPPSPALVPRALPWAPPRLRGAAPELLAPAASSGRVPRALAGLLPHNPTGSREGPETGLAGMRLSPQRVDPGPRITNDDDLDVADGEAELENQLRNARATMRLPWY